MPLNLSDLLKKAEKKGMVQQNDVALMGSSSPASLLRPWQQESILYAHEENKITPSEVFNSTNSKKPEPNLSQTEAKLESKLSQTEAKLEPNYAIDLTIAKKLEPNLSQTEAKLEPKLKSKLSQTEAKGKSNLSQSEAKVKPKSYFSGLIGLQRKLVLVIYEICQTILEQKTNPLSIEFLATQCQSPKSAVRKAIQRLEQKGIIIRVGFKNGRGGWTQYQLPDQIYQEILMLKNKKLEPNLSQTWVKLEPNLSQSEAKVGTELEPELRPNASCSSSNIYINNTTTTGTENEWDFDIAPYARFGFTKTQIKQLVPSGVISAREVEQSLIEFSYDVDNNALPSIKTTKINFLMGLLWKGQSYVSEGFKNEQEATISEMARRAEGKRKKLLEEKFIAWEADLTNEQRKKIEKDLPTSLLVLHRTYGISHQDVRMWFFNYYLTAVK